MKKRRRKQMAAMGLCFGLAAACISGCGQSGDDVKDTVQSESDGTKEADGQTQGAGTQTGKDYLEGIDLAYDEALDYDFSEVSVHDPSIIKAGDRYYIFGSHLAAASSADLVHWDLIDSGVRPDNVIIPDAAAEMSEAFTWAQTDTFWAPDVIQLADGRYYMYYCNCQGTSPLSALGIAVADQPEGPYKDLGIILKSGQGADEPDENGDIYDAAVEPNAVDPCVFFDKDGKLWMVYGSYSGGIYILELDPESGFPLETGYGKKLLGGNHLRIEAPYIIYSPETDYYYLFLSFGGLASDGGYNIRVCRSKTPDGPYYDSEGQNMEDCKGPQGSAFDDSAAAGYGVKLMGNFSFEYTEGEFGQYRAGYVSPGHNSAIRDDETGNYFLIFHTRFEGKDEQHQVRVHQMYLNEDGWFVVSPYRYTGGPAEAAEEEMVPGPCKIINHLHNITSNIQKSDDIILNEDHTVTGAYKGTWEMKEDGQAVLILNDVEYHGFFKKQWDQYGFKNAITFTALSDKGYAIWGSGYEAEP